MESIEIELWISSFLAVWYQYSRMKYIKRLELNMKFALTRYTYKIITFEMV